MDDAVFERVVVLWPSDQGAHKKCDPKLANLVVLDFLDDFDDVEEVAAALPADVRNYGLVEERN